jgi:hypothetical protein
VILLNIVNIYFIRKNFSKFLKEMYKNGRVTAVASYTSMFSKNSSRTLYMLEVHLLFTADAVLLHHMFLTHTIVLYLCEEK